MKTISYSKSRRSAQYFVYNLIRIHFHTGHYQLSRFFIPGCITWRPFRPSETRPSVRLLSRPMTRCRQQQQGVGRQRGQTSARVHHLLGRHLGVKYERGSGLKMSGLVSAQARRRSVITMPSLNPKKS